MVPLPGLGVAAVVVNLTRREEQHIAGAADKLLVVVLNHALAAHRQIENIALHPQRTVNIEIEIAVGFNGRQPRHQMGVKRVAG